MSQLSPLQQRFLDLLLLNGVLKFGEFKTKSGRITPYFFNTGAFDHGRLLRNVAQCYAELIVSQAPHVQHLYGPAYKGITLASATSISLCDLAKRDISFTFNRKEAKDYGEGGSLVGRSLNSNTPVVIVEDVMTGGTSIRESMELLTRLNVPVLGVAIGVDRQERGTLNKRASLEVQDTFGFPVWSILTMSDIISELWAPDGAKLRHGRCWIDHDLKHKIDQYQREWC